MERYRSPVLSTGLEKWVVDTYLEMTKNEQINR